MVHVCVCCTVPGVGLTPTATPSKDQLGKALAVTHKSTASLGKFMDTLPKEKLKGLGKKRKVSMHTGQACRKGPVPFKVVSMYSGKHICAPPHPTEVAFKSISVT